MRFDRDAALGAEKTHKQREERQAVSPGGAQFRERSERLLCAQIARSKQDAAVRPRFDDAGSKAIHSEVDGDHILVKEIKRPDVESCPGQIDPAWRFGGNAQEVTIAPNRLLNLKTVSCV